MSTSIRQVRRGLRPSHTENQRARTTSRRGDLTPQFPSFVLPLLALVAALLSASFVRAQPQRVPPHIGYAYPAGGRQGTTFTMSVGGQNLNETQQAHFADAGITAKVTGYDRPMTPKELNDLREKIQALAERRAAALGLPTPDRPNAKTGKPSGSEAARPAKSAASNAGVAAAGSAASTSTPASAPDGMIPSTAAPRPTWTPEDQKQLVELREKLMRRVNRNTNPAIAETVTLEVTIAPDATVGDHELRLRTPFGISNPLLVQVGQLPEITKPVVTATTDASSRQKRATGVRPTRPQPVDREITLPATVNGQILPGAVDRYRFTARKGLHLVIAVSARNLIPYLADAVPGWFEATVALYDLQGREVAYGDSYRFNPDPVVAYDIPVDGDYALEVKDSIYRGREDFVYRIAIGELPFVTSLFPLGGNPGGKIEFQVAGWNLPIHSLLVDAKDQRAGTFLLSVRNGAELSNPVRFAIADEPECRANEADLGSNQAQSLTLPVVVDGRLDRPDQTASFQFNGSAGQEIVAEIVARRLGSPLDSTLELTDAGGRRLAFNDDFVDPGAGLETHHADSRLSAKLPAAGTYFLRVTDAQHRGGPDYSYRLRVGPPRPDFELRVTPSGITARPGGQAAITVYALRHDGFSGPIVLGLEDPSPGFALMAARIPAGQDKVQLTLSVPPGVRRELIPLTIYGAALIGDAQISHPAVPADDMMQAFAYHHLVIAKELVVDVTGQPAPRWRVASATPIRVPITGNARIALGAPMLRNLKKVIVELADAPEGIVATAGPIAGDTVDVLVTADPTKLKPGTSGNLILNLFAERTNPKAKGAQRVQRFPLGTAPAIPFEITPAEPVASR
ncbi:MAG TPA: hypothetical protein VHE61_18810 [Opitutaceae bacterium]|nr:hypothetical protein [Opitutaceae bacterium]